MENRRTLTLNSLPTWARLEGFDDVEWSEEAVPRPDYAWPRMESSPVVGQQYGLMSRERLPESTFWTLYEPAFTSINGWCERPSEIADSAIVRCRFVELLGEFDWGSYGRGFGMAAEVEEVIGIRDLVHRYPSDPSGPLPDLPPQSRMLTEWEDLRYFEGHQESVVYGALLVHTVGDERALVLYRSSFFDEARFYAGHHPLSESELSRLADDFGPGSR